MLEISTEDVESWKRKKRRKILISDFQIKMALTLLIEPLNSPFKKSNNIQHLK